ncbi:flocculation protein FLO11-like [Lytechinus variegatus]|uniref:flocculation protein FLO11-like n=1 Tax=Lytechinus variegatus TaxID=7654 RepID=UPI001BB0ECE7|nr:flocculation protein FLO11-like [Lytechinus variegatus]XP_041453523.1 flocculation protein FLO11-like [Lytechinus variegatus]XP_041453531.1 flocculation protein FLO11-like [Lytechinus variegatus]XP_041453537.1 flocculation protein FLO11-like [Lytechinus variegatus]XP_041453541.1 flocculation protein FLO11-like [Lytechinus variegatus]XP_041453547.1 flocculation protein FLO11-like [Lytechinus variegatus]
MATVYSLISLLVCIHQTSASSSSQIKRAHPHAPSSSTSLLHSSSTPPSMSSSSMSSPSPQLSNMLNTTSSTISTMTWALSINDTQPPTRGQSSRSRSVHPSPKATSKTIYAPSSSEPLFVMTSSFYEGNLNTSTMSTNFWDGDIYITTTEEIWLSTLDQDAEITTATPVSQIPITLISQPPASHMSSLLSPSPSTMPSAASPSTRVNIPSQQPSTLIPSLPPSTPIPSFSSSPSISSSSSQSTPSTPIPSSSSARPIPSSSSSSSTSSPISQLSTPIPSSSIGNHSIHQSPFSTPPPPSVIPSPSTSMSSGAMSNAADTRTSSFPHSISMFISSTYESDRVTSSVLGSSTGDSASVSMTSSTTYDFNGSLPISATQSMSPTFEIISSFIDLNVTSFVESYTILMTASADVNVSVESPQPTMQLFTQLISSETPEIHSTPISSDYRMPMPSSASPIASSSNILLSASMSGIPSAMPSTSSFTASTANPASHIPPTESASTEATTDGNKTTLGVYYPVRCTIKLGGDCRQVKAKEDAFKSNFIESISSLMSLDHSRISVNSVKCGSVVVDFTLQDTADFAFAEDLYGYMDSTDITVPFENQTLTAETIEFHDGPYAPTTPKPSEAPPVSDDDEGGLTFEQQQRLIYILIGVVVGFVILLAIILVVHHVVRRTCSKSQQSFDLQDEPCIKLTDFNMAHTCIPRPRSIYSSIGADGRFFRYDNREDNTYPPASPTSFIYADSRDIKEHYHEVIDPDDQDPSTSDMQNQKDFGRSGLPEWNLPLVDGASAVSPDLLNTIDSHHSSHPSTSSDTFRPPSAASSTLNNPPVFSPPAPPPPPPPPLPTPIIQSGTLRSRHSCDAGSEMTDSSGDTNTLTKGSSDVGTSMMGIDNPLMTPEEYYDIPGPSTSDRMSRYIVR